MRLLTLLQLSTAAACPLVLLALNEGANQTANSSLPPDNSNGSKLQPKITAPPPVASTSNIAPPERITPRSTNSPLPKPAFANKPLPKIAIASTPSAQKPPLAIRSGGLFDDITWDRLVAKSLPASVFDSPAPKSTPLKATATIAQKPPSKSASPGKSIAQPNRAVGSTPMPPATLFSQALPSAPLPPLGNPTTIDNSTALRSETAYVLGVGDGLQVTIVNVPEFSGKYQIALDGSITLPVVGRAEIAGMSIPDAEKTIAAQLSRELRRPRVFLSVIKSRPIRVGIAGEIRQPGFYTLPTTDDITPPNLAQAIQAAGGLNLSANVQQIEIRRRDRTKGIQKFTVNLSNLAQAGDLSQNLTLRDGDSLYIPASAIVDVATMGQLADSNLATATQSINVSLVGEVNRPGAYKVEGGKDAASRPTVTQAIQQAGGITTDADLRQVQVQRMTRSGKPQLITLNFTQLIREGDLNQDMLLQPGDRIRLLKAPNPTAADLIEQGGSNLSTPARINVLGEVKSPGAIQVQANSTLNQALLAAGGFDRRAAKSVELIRLNPNGTVTRRSIQVDLSKGIDPANNPVLRNNDVIVVGRSGLAKFTDGVSDILDPFFRLLPLKLLF